MARVIGGQAAARKADIREKAPAESAKRRLADLSIDS
jgi:hypothetical protein